MSKYVGCQSQSTNAPQLQVGLEFEQKPLSGAFLTLLNLQLVDVTLWHHLGPAAGAEADRRRAAGGGHRAEGHVGGGDVG